MTGVDLEKNLYQTIELGNVLPTQFKILCMPVLSEIKIRQPMQIYGLIYFHFKKEALLNFKFVLTVIIPMEIGDNKLMYISYDDKQSYPFCRWMLLVEKFRQY